MIKEVQNNKGITIIALIITIIILLILAGIAISMISGENGVLQQTKSTKKEAEKESIKGALQRASVVALTSGNGKINLDVLNKELDDVGYKGNDIKELPEIIKVGNNRYIILKDGTIVEATSVEENIGKVIVESKAIMEDEDGEIIVVPPGFKIKSDSPALVSKGIVVVAPDGSEFVWVPVENAIYDNENVSKIPTSSTAGSLTGYTYTPMAIDINGDYRGLLYSFNSTGGAYLMYASAENYQGTTEERREPDVLTNTTYGDYAKGKTLLKNIVKLDGTDEQIKTQWLYQLQDEYNEMIRYVEENKGFYVGRYETSLRTGEDGTTNIAQSKGNIISATAAADSANTWYGLYQLEKEYSEKNNLTDVVGSSMIWGSQYDQMMIWMQHNDINVTSITPITGASYNTSKETGSVETDKLNNVYDLLGNNYEWTLEANATNVRCRRTGGNSGDYGPMYRLNSGYAYSDTYNYVSSRITLFVK